MDVRAKLFERNRLRFSQIFFFQAEDGIRDADVTGVQTCALPIYPERLEDLETIDAYLQNEYGVNVNMSLVQYLKILNRASHAGNTAYFSVPTSKKDIRQFKRMRSEERRVGKECRSRWSPYQ